MMRMTNTKKPKSSTGRPTIGLISNFSYETVEGYDSVLLSGIVDATRDCNVNLICFAGGHLHNGPSEDCMSQRNVIYDLATVDNIDGLIFASTMMVRREAEVKRMKAFCKSYRPTPRVNIGLALDNIPSIIVDNETGLYDLISHLIGDHGCQRIAFICGLEGHTEAEQRYHSYKMALSWHGLSLDFNLVAPGDFLPSAGEAAINLLLDTRKLQHKIDFDAVVSANDYMAFSALEALNMRGIRVPTDHL